MAFWWLQLEVHGAFMVSGWAHWFKCFSLLYLRGEQRDCLWGLATDRPMICILRTQTGILVPFAFLPLFHLVLRLCILSFLLPTHNTYLLESHKTSILTKNTGVPLLFFKGDFFWHWSEYRNCLCHAGCSQTHCRSINSWKLDLCSAIPNIEKFRDSEKFRLFRTAYLKRSW